jgi:hypothetical protein
MPLQPFKAILANSFELLVNVGGTEEFCATRSVYFPIRIGR